VLPEDVVPDEVLVYPENALAVAVFLDLGTQWRHGGMGGVTGLDYAVLPAVFELRGIAPEERPDLFDCLRVMEREVLVMMAEQRKNG
jgi:hypothetical protein